MTRPAQPTLTDPRETTPTQPAPPPLGLRELAIVTAIAEALRREPLKGSEGYTAWTLQIRIGDKVHCRSWAEDR